MTFIIVLSDETKSAASKDKLRTKCSEYLERAEKLKKHLKNTEKESFKELGGSSKDDGKSGDEEPNSDDAEKNNLQSKLERAIVIETRCSPGDPEREVSGDKLLESPITMVKHTSVAVKNFNKYLRFLSCFFRTIC